MIEMTRSLAVAKRPSNYAVSLKPWNVASGSP